MGVLIIGKRKQTVKIHSSMHRLMILALHVFMAVVCLGGCYSYHEMNWTDLNLIVGEIKECTASWYGKDFHKKLTASGDIYNMYDLTCAHKKYPFGTIIRVTNLSNGKDELCVVNDRGPYCWFRKLDLSYGVAKNLDFVEQGIGDVQIEVLGRDYSYARYIEYGSLNQASALTIQVGSFTDNHIAKALKDELTLHYKNVYISDTIEDHEKSYRVRIGKFRNRAAALKVAARIVKEGYTVMIVPFDA